MPIEDINHWRHDFCTAFAGALVLSATQSGPCMADHGLNRMTGMLMTCARSRLLQLLYQDRLHSAPAGNGVRLTLCALHRVPPGAGVRADRWAHFSAAGTLRV